MEYMDILADSNIGILKELRPATSFPTGKLSDNTVHEHGLLRVVRTLEHDSKTQQLNELTVPLIVDADAILVEVVAKPDEDQMSAMLAEKLQFIKNEKFSLQNGGFTYQSNVFQTDALSRSSLNGAVTLNAFTLNAHGDGWITVDNEQILMDEEELQDFSVAMGLFFRLVHEHKMLLEAELKAATTLSEITAIDETEGWPDNGIPNES